jgi:hypothetical protein
LADYKRLSNDGPTAKGEPIFSVTVSVLLKQFGMEATWVEFIISLADRISNIPDYNGMASNLILL